MSPRRKSIVSSSDDIAVLILVLTFPVLAWDLRRGGWRGCVLSAAWCQKSDDGDLTEEENADDLPAGTLSSRLVAVVGTVTAFAIRAASLWRRRKYLLPNSNTSAAARVRSIIALWTMSHLSMVGCALIPMSCGALLDGDGWVYLSWRDVAHDGLLFTLFAASVAAGVKAKYHKTRPVLLRFCLVLGMMQTVGIWRCPTAPDDERIALIVLEVAAIAATQFLLRGTIDELVALNGHTFPVIRSSDAIQSV